ncbi:Detected protein of unknown function [Hibiscus syriacus]|uniref:Uncharacterized protein n=1 Tax=Hibiscus syriacus TaxID=106335 RepID=A0A6A2XV32_HIBSY|nr:Detected protein of unknown function [Hibiscus syriacus]
MLTFEFCRYSESIDDFRMLYLEKEHRILRKIHHVFSFRKWDPTAFSKPGFEHPVWFSWSGVKGNPKTAQLNLGGSYFEGEIAAISGRHHTSRVCIVIKSQVPGQFKFYSFRSTPETKPPKELSNLTKLEALYFFKNSFTGEIWGPIPPNLCYGNKLFKLILFNNMLKHELPGNFVNCTSLSRFRIQNILNSLSSNIWGAPSLQIFSASSAKLTGEISNFIGCKNIYKIELQGSSLNGSIPWYIDHCEKLVFEFKQKFVYWNNSMEILTLPSITVVDLSHNLPTGTIPSNFKNCSTLKKFGVSYNLLTGPIPSPGLIFPNLHPSLFCGNNSLYGKILARLCLVEAMAEAMAIGDMEVRN